MSTSVKKPNQPKQILVSPVVSDPSMRNSKGPAEMLLNNELGADAEVQDVVFGSNRKQTKEESEHISAPTETNTMVIIAFSLVVIALVAIIVWMVMRNSNDKKEEEEIRRQIRPHPRNNMPPNQLRQQQMRNQQMHNQQMQMQMQQQQPNQQPNMQQQQQPNMQQQLGPQQSPAPTEVRVETNHEYKPSNNVENKETPTENKEFSKDNPHPSIIRPEQPKSDVDDVMEKATIMLNAVKNKPTSDMTELDKALLDNLDKNTEL